MRCIVCHKGSLRTVNSRKSATDLRVWRRRKCEACGLIFTTRELPDFDRAFQIQHGRRKSTASPFEKARLLAQLFAAGGHLKKPEDLVWLAETIAAKAFLKAVESSFIISSIDYRFLVLSTLEAYDKLLGANFAVRNPV